MESQRKNKSLFIDKEALFALLLCKEGLLAPLNHLMNQEEMEEVDRSGLYQQQTFPFSFILAPSGKRNQEVMKNAKKGEILNLVCDNEICGNLIVDSSFPIDRQQRLFKIMSGDIYNKKAQNIYNRLGDFAICGEYELNIQYGLLPNEISKAKIDQAKKELQAQNVASMFLEASPITRIHERIFRSVLDESDLLVLFLLKKQNEDLLSFEIRKQCLEYIIKHFLPKDRIMIFPLDDIYLFAGAHGILLDAIISQNLGCDKIVVGETYPHLTLYYDKQRIYSIFDTAKDIKINIKLLNEFVYCEQCSTIVSIKSCPHGKHHHVNYHSSFIQGILQSGLIPPTILVRKEISAKILAYLFPNRFNNLIKKFNTMFAGEGIIRQKNEEDFYIKLIHLYQTHSLN